MPSEAVRATVTLVIDGREVTAPRGTTVYQAARAAGVDIPIFCYHDRMPPLGACRMCLVEVEKMPKLQTACTLEAADGMVVSTTSPAVAAAQASILELLLSNHPLDCPICDKGGECPLQDQAFRYGEGRSRFVETKRDYAKPISLGPVLVLDRERCILCWRCVRFGEIIAGDDALKGFERGFASAIGTPFGLPVESKFIGNAIAICPVGALTSRTYRFRARPWDIEPVASSCAHCGLGCAVWLDVRGGEILRTRAREDPGINDVWLCDLGFFGHAYVAARDRLTTPLVRREGRLQRASWEDALGVVAERLRASLARGPGRVAFLGGRRLSNADAAAAAWFFRAVARTPHLDHRVDASPDGASLRVGWGLRSSLEDLARGDVFVLVGCDLTEEYPVLWLRIKAAIDRGARLVIVHSKRLEIRAHARCEIICRHDQLAQLTAELAAAVAQHGGAGCGASRIDLAANIMATGSRVHLLLGRFALDGPGGCDLLRSAQALSQRAGVTLHIARGRGNDIGAARLGLLPGEGGMHAPGILRGAAADGFDLLYVAGSDPATTVDDRAAWDAARMGVGFLVVHEAFLSATAQAADVVLPALVAPEKDGTITNLEGRTLPLRAVVAGPGRARADQEIFELLAARLGVVRGHVAAAPVGSVVPTPVETAHAAGAAQEPAAAGGAAPPLVLAVSEHLFTRGSMTGRCPGLAELVGTAHCLIHPSDAARADVAHLDLVELATEHAALVVQARVSEDVPPGQVLLPRGHDTAPAGALVRWSPAPVGVQIRPIAPSGGAEP